MVSPAPNSWSRPTSKHGISVLGLRHTHEDQIASFGTVTGIWIEEPQLLNVTEFAEKPTVDYAQNNLRVPGLPEDEYLTVFGAVHHQATDL